MSLIEHMRGEFEALGWPGDDEVQMEMCKNIEEVVTIIAEQGHTGFTIQYFMNLLTALIDYKPLAPLTGKDDEWVNVSETDEPFYQNKRDSTVFKDSTGDAYCIDIVIFRDADGDTFTNHYSRVPVEFPWTRPNHVYVDVGGEPSVVEE